MISVPLYEIAREFTRITKMDFRNQKHKIHSLPIFEIAAMTESIRQLKNGLQCFDAFVPSDVVKVLMSRNASARLGVVRRRMTIFFINTRFENTNNLSPNLLVEMLQIMFTTFAQIVTDEGGVVDKYLSEGMMCLFNAPLSIDDHELRSIRACYKIDGSVHELNREWINKGHPNISIPIGVNTDQCFIGNVGSRSRVNYTALGDAVNVASRLTSINKQYHTSIMIGHKTKEAVQDYFVCRWISFVCVKGKSQPLHVFEVLSEREKASDKQKELESLTSQVKQLIEENNINSALSLVVKLLSGYPRDKALIELRTRLESPNFCPYVEVGRKE